MDDAEQSNISTAITLVLPDLAAAILNILEETLQSLGVETTEDFHFIQEADLLPVLRPVQARKLVAAWKQTTQSTGIHNQSALTSPASSTCSSSSPSPSLSPFSLPIRSITAADWIDSFQIPWTKFPEALMQ
ncbi:hypothetical protein LDENG_00139380 [Lucifuga dentata]|nr:hypothetical protein LDENG_00139380 [Lucifuga dentata]